METWTERGDAWLTGVRIVVKRQPGSRQWGVYLNDVLHEGGFFSKAAAERCAQEAK